MRINSEKVVFQISAEKRPWAHLVLSAENGSPYPVFGEGEARTWGWESGLEPCAKAPVRCVKGIEVTNPSLVRKIKRIYAIISARLETQSF